MLRYQNLPEEEKNQKGWLSIKKIFIFLLFYLGRSMK